MCSQSTPPVSYGRATSARIPSGPRRLASVIPRAGPGPRSSRGDDRRADPGPFRRHLRWRGWTGGRRRGGPGDLRPEHFEHASAGRVVDRVVPEQREHPGIRLGRYARTDDHHLADDPGRRQQVEVRGGGGLERGCDSRWTDAGGPRGRPARSARAPPTRQPPKQAWPPRNPLSPRLGRAQPALRTP